MVKHPVIVKLFNVSLSENERYLGLGHAMHLKMAQPFSSFPLAMGLYSGAQSTIGHAIAALHSYFGQPLSSFPTLVCLVPGLHIINIGGHLETIEHLIIGHPFLSFPAMCVLAKGGHLLVGHSTFGLKGRQFVACFKLSQLEQHF